MIDWLLFGGWLIGFLPCWRTAAWILAHDLGGDCPDGFDTIAGVALGGVVAVAWPVVFPLRVAYVNGWLAASSHAIQGGFMRPPKKEREKILRQEIIRRDYEIAALEQMLEADGTLTKRSA